MEKALSRVTTTMYLVVVPEELLTVISRYVIDGFLYGLLSNRWMRRVYLFIGLKRVVLAIRYLV
jgi:hypothetical protein